MDLLSRGGGSGTTTPSNIASGSNDLISNSLDGQHNQQSFSWAAKAVAAAGQHLVEAQQHQQASAAAFLSSPHSTISQTAATSDMNGPILFTEANRSSAIDDVRSGVLYIFIGSVFLSFFLILPGIRNDKLPTFLCITTSLLVASIILIGLFGTTWHIGEAPQMSAAYKAFSRDRIQGELRVKIGLNSVNITLQAHKYYILNELDGPIVLMDSRMMSSDGSLASRRSSGLLASLMPISPVGSMQSIEVPDQVEDNQGSAARFINLDNKQVNNNSLSGELLGSHISDGISVDLELESDEVFSSDDQSSKSRLARSSLRINPKNFTQNNSSSTRGQRNKRDNGQTTSNGSAKSPEPKYTIRRVNHVDINYNERFYWIEPQQMRYEYHKALERGLPYPILTVVEYLSQDDAGFNWSRQYRTAGYYTSILLWLSASLCLLMFSLHCAAPKYGIYTMQLLGCLLLFTTYTYSMLVPRGDKELVIPFEGHSLRFRFGASFWLVLVGGCISLCVGTIIVIVDRLLPNFIFTTVLDADFDVHQDNYMKQKYFNEKRSIQESGLDQIRIGPQRPEPPAFMMKRKAVAAS